MPAALLPILLVYATASQYPGMPAWLSPAVVYAAWAGATAIGVLGYWLRRPVLLVAYGGYGVGVLAHYALAPPAAAAAALLFATLQRRGT